MKKDELKLREKIHEDLSPDFDQKFWNKFDNEFTEEPVSLMPWVSGLAVAGLVGALLIYQFKSNSSLTQTKIWHPSPLSPVLRVLTTDPM